MRLAVLLAFCAIGYGAERQDINVRVKNEYSVCVKNEYSLNPDTIRYFMLSLTSYEKELGAVFQYRCDSVSAAVVTIRLRGTPAGYQNADALGAVPAGNGNVLPKLDVFCDPVRRMLRARRPVTPSLEGWALAKVAAHEMYHYRWQKFGHQHSELSEGLMTPDRLIQGFQEIARLERQGN